MTRARWYLYRCVQVAPGVAIALFLWWRTDGIFPWWTYPIIDPVIAAIPVAFLLVGPPTYEAYLRRFDGRS